MSSTGMTKALFLKPENRRAVSRRKVAGMAIALFPIWADGYNRRRRENMNRLFLLIAGVSALGLYFVITPMVAGNYRRYRGRKTVICPQTGQIAEMELKAGRAGLLSIFGKTPARVKWCSQWPRKKGCSEECVKEYWESAPEVENRRVNSAKLS